LVALGAGLTGFMALVDLVDLAAGFPVVFAPLTMVDLVDFAELLTAVFGAGLALVAAAIAGAVIRNAAARADARIFFKLEHLLP
jgi:hypothetical protein